MTTRKLCSCGKQMELYATFLDSGALLYWGCSCNPSYLFAIFHGNILTPEETARYCGEPKGSIHNHLLKKGFSITSAGNIDSTTLAEIAYLYKLTDGKPLDGFRIDKVVWNSLKIGGIKLMDTFGIPRVIVIEWLKETAKELGVTGD